jgi:hypothetical protein
MHVQAWALHDAVIVLAREHGLRSYRVECKAGPEGETVIALVLLPTDAPGVRNTRPDRRWR